ncbi:hypothetical protein PMAYCL1PPCAC_26798, partial [Pristionchus mayeri]
MPIVRRDICNLRWAEESVNSGYQKDVFLHQFASIDVICAGSMGHAVAQGDSGGPLMMKAADDRWFQIGIASFGNPNKFIEADISPNIFTDIRPYCDWITETTGGEASCQEEEVKLEDVKV